MERNWSTTPQNGKMAYREKVTELIELTVRLEIMAPAGSFPTGAIISFSATSDRLGSQS